MGSSAPKFVWPLLLTLYAALIGLLAAWLNARFYQTHGPFYDSMSYYNQLARVMQATREHGLGAALGQALHHSTVFLPWLFGALLANIVEPSRQLGTLLQMPLLFLQLFTAYRFFLACGVSRARAALYALPLISYPAIFNFNGGLPDFRMDLSQALAFGSFLAALMTARLKTDYREWTWLGVVIAIACLARATTPVYVTLVMAVALGLDLGRLGLLACLRRYALTTGVVVLLTAWFYLLNFDYLHYYYFVWNTDANAHLPLRQAAQHLFFINDEIGRSLRFALLALLACRLLQGRLRHINWIALAGGAIPAGYLVLSGAGLNPFVSMVALPGLLLFALHPAAQPTAPHRLLAPLCAVILIGGLAHSLFTSVRDHDKSISTWIPYMSGVRQLTDGIAADSRQLGRTRANLAFLYLGSVDGMVVSNHLIFDKGFHFGKQDDVDGPDFSFRTIKFGFGAAAEWREIPGADDQAKVDRVFDDALNGGDYIIMADAGSDLPTHHLINHFSAPIRERLASSPAVERIIAGLPLSASEKVSIYRVRRDDGTRLPAHD